MQCPTCGGPVENGRPCPACGALVQQPPLIASISCRKCGIPANPEQSYCTRCGEKLPPRDTDPEVANTRGKLSRKEELREVAGGHLGALGEIDLPREKSVLAAYIFWLMLGPLAIHRLYLGCVISWLLYLLTLSFLGVGWLIDLFRIPTITRKANRRIWTKWFTAQSERWMEVQGTACNVELSTVQAGSYPGAQSSKQLLKFRVEQVDQGGDIRRRIPVEMIGTMITGSLRDGDSISLAGKLSREKTVRALAVTNQTTGAQIRVEF